MISTAATIGWVTATLFLGAGGETSKPLQDTLERAEKCFKAGNHEGALREFRKALFAVPGQKTALQREKEIIKILSTKLIEEGDRVWDSSPGSAIDRYRQAEGLDPQGPVKAAFTKRGFKFYQGRWRTKEGIEAYKRTDATRAADDLKKLGFPKGFRAVRLGVFRFFTDTDEKSSRTIQMMNAIQALFDEYLRVMKPFSPVLPEEGLEVVLFQKEEDYRRHTQSKGTVGVYKPRLGVSFFYVTKEGEDFATLLHEITHQLNHKVTDVLGKPSCFEEGMAEYFSLGALTNGGRKLTVGVGRGDRFTPVREAIRKGSAFIPFEDLFRKDAKDDDDLFYPESYALTYYLMEAHPQGRYILYDVHAAAKYTPVLEVRGRPSEPGADGGDGGDGGDGDDDGDNKVSPSHWLVEDSDSRPPVQFPRSMADILTGYGLTPAKLEEQFRTYCKTLR